MHHPWQRNLAGQIKAETTQKSEPAWLYEASLLLMCWVFSRGQSRLLEATAVDRLHALTLNQISHHRDSPGDLGRFPSSMSDSIKRACTSLVQCVVYFDTFAFPAYLYKSLAVNKVDKTTVNRSLECALHLPKC